MGQYQSKVSRKFSASSNTANAFTYRLMPPCNCTQTGACRWVHPRANCIYISISSIWHLITRM